MMTGRTLRARCGVGTPKGYGTLTIEDYKEGRAVVSRCIELDVASCGHAVEAALSAVREGIA